MVSFLPSHVDCLCTAPKMRINGRLAIDLVRSHHHQLGCGLSLGL